MCRSAIAVAEMRLRSGHATMDHLPRSVASVRTPPQVVEARRTCFGARQPDRARRGRPHTLDDQRTVDDRAVHLRPDDRPGISERYRADLHATEGRVRLRTFHYAGSRATVVRHAEPDVEANSPCSDTCRCPGRRTRRAARVADALHELDGPASPARDSLSTVATMMPADRPASMSARMPSRMGRLVLLPNLSSSGSATLTVTSCLRATPR